VLQSAPNTGIAGGALVQSSVPWSVGRGWFNGPADFFDGHRRGVNQRCRFDPSQFLFTRIPEPRSVLVSLIAMMSFWSGDGHGRGAHS
jgi:hypothetical protein